MMKKLLSAGLLLLVCFQPARPAEIDAITAATTPSYINVRDYMPFNLGAIFTYDDGSQAVITRTVELDWLGGATAYEKVWTLNPNSPYPDNGVKDYYMVRGDSLFWAAHSYFDPEGYFQTNQLNPPGLLGTATAVPGDTFTTSVVITDAVNPGAPESLTILCIVDTVGPVSVPAGIYPDCIKLTLLMEKEVLQVIYLAKGVGMIMGQDIDVTSEETPSHSLTSYRPGGPFNIQDYFPLTQGLTWTYDDGAKAALTGEKLLLQETAPAVEKIWVRNPSAHYDDGQVAEYYITRGDSLFWVRHFYREQDGAGAEQFEPGILLGLNSMTSGFTFSGNAADIDPLGGMDSQVDYTLQALAAGTVTTPSGTYENCLRLAFSALFTGEPEAFEFSMVLAKNVGAIISTDFDAMMEDSVAHRLTGSAQAAVYNLLEYFPLTTGKSWAFDNGAGAEITGTETLPGMQNASFVRTWTSNPVQDQPDSASKDYFLVRGDSLFLCRYLIGFTGGDADGIQFDPPILLGTSHVNAYQSFRTTATDVDTLGGSGQSYSCLALVMLEDEVTVSGKTYSDCLGVYLVDEADYTMLEGMILAKGKGPVKLFKLSLGGDDFHSIVQQAVRGELTGDGKINIFDLLELLKYLKNPAGAPAEADMNDDGKINIFDLIALLGKL